MSRDFRVLGDARPDLIPAPARLTARQMLLAAHMARTRLPVDAGVAEAAALAVCARHPDLPRPGYASPQMSGSSGQPPLTRDLAATSGPGQPDARELLAMLGLWHPDGPLTTGRARPRGATPRRHAHIKRRKAA